MILTDPSLLRESCEDVLPEEVQSIKLELETELKKSEKQGLPGLGLAAPQIGIYKKMAIIRINYGLRKICHIDLVNCNIKDKYDIDIFESEGCLSFPGVYKRTKRFKEIYVVNNMVKPYSFIATGLISVVVQHELDHLIGKLLCDMENYE